MMTKKKSAKISGPVLDSHGKLKLTKGIPPVEKPAFNLEGDFPPEVMDHAKETGKTPFVSWFEKDGTVLGIQWTDFSKDRYPVG
jgi:hypothetical protein